MENQSEHSLSEGFINALLYPFKPGVLLYNVVALLFLGVVFNTMISWSTTIESRFADFNAQLEQQVDDDAVLTAEQNQEIEKMLALFREQGASEENLQLMRKQLEIPYKLSPNTDMPSIATDVPEIPSPPMWLLLPILIASYLITTKNFDVTAQIADGDFDAPTLKLCQYVSPFIAIKLFIGSFILSLLLWGILFVLGLFLAFFPMVMFIVIALLGLFCLAIYPAIVLSLIRTNSLWGVLNPRLWKETIVDHVGAKNYLLLLVLMFVIFVLSNVMNMVFTTIAGVDNSLLSLLMFVLLMYLALHLGSANHYLMGFMTQHETPDFAKADFSGYEKKAVANKQQHSLLADAKQCIQKGYDDDAISLLEIVTQDVTNSDDVVSAYELLLQIYDRQNNVGKHNETRQRLMHFVQTQAPQHASRVLPMRLALAKSGEMPPAADEVKTLAEFAYAQQDYTGVLKVVGMFAKQYPDHVDIAANYLLVGRALRANKQYKKAYQILGGLLNKYPNDPLALDIKSELALVKRQMTSAKKSF